ncbi:MAG: (2Fe-2S)-binding protein [Betaproteobacteria bacterium]|nr:MAG: (2Fe-2S)-binding protein [Betaproteobacteria bacterium]
MQPILKTIRFRLNGEPVATQVATHENVVEALQRLGLHGARESCGQGLCGCCTVLVDGNAVSGCLYFAVQLEGASVETIERQQPAGGLDEVQQAFAECGAFQCGFCTPGFVLMSRALLDRNPDPSEDDIRHYLSGNLCRCATYPEVIRAVKLAAARRKVRP